jgi:hypothetical protein
MLLLEARRAARVSTSGELIVLGEQDRGAWDRELIAEGHALVRERLATGVAPGRYQLLAAINAVHTDARDIRDTDWSQVLALYDQLVRLDPSPIVRLNRAVAVAELDGPEVALADVAGVVGHRDPLLATGAAPREGRAAFGRSGPVDAGSEDRMCGSYACGRWPARRSVTTPPCLSRSRQAESAGSRSGSSCRCPGWHRPPLPRSSPHRRADWRSPTSGPRR